MLLENGIHLAYSLVSHGTHLAYGRMGGWRAEDGGPAARALTGGGKTQEAAARQLVEGAARVYHAPNLKTSLWALGEACELLAAALGANRQHEFYVCDGIKCRDHHCVYCEGGLAYCVKCKQGEGELEDYCNGR